MAAPFPFPSPMFARGGSPLLPAAVPQASNPWVNFFANAATDLGYGLTHSTDLSGALGAATQQTAQLQPYREQADYTKAEKAKADAQLAAQTNQTQQWLAKNRPDLAGLPVDQAWQLAMKSQGGSNGATFGQTPVFLVDDKGNQHAAQMSSAGGIFIDGQTVPSIPPNWKVVARPDNLSLQDFGGYKAPFDPNSGTVGAPIPVQGSPSTNMDVTMSPDGGRVMAPASGSDEAIKRRGNLTAAQSALSSLELKQGVVGTNIDRALQIAQNVPSTGIFSLANAVYGTPQYDLKATLDTIKANVGFDQLQQMRDNSPTGGALGQVSEQENRLLQSVLGSLDQAQSLDQFVQNLQLLKQVLAQSTDARRRAFAQDFPDSGLPQGASPVGPGPSPGGTQTLVYNPNTGELE